MSYINRRLTTIEKTINVDTVSWRYWTTESDGTYKLYQDTSNELEPNLTIPQHSIGDYETPRRRNFILNASREYMDVI